jgi:hypothetical protein
MRGLQVFYYMPQEKIDNLKMYFLPKRAKYNLYTLEFGGTKPFDKAFCSSLVSGQCNRIVLSSIQ